ncbi:MAG: hypothetical protein ACRD0Q_05155 [Acidimicrobiales bacterium]
MEAPLRSIGLLLAARLAELMGHSSVQITLDRYSHVMPRLTTALAERIDAAYRAAEPAPSSAATVRSATVVEL